jgi:hypothetical protein
VRAECRQRVRKSPARAPDESAFSPIPLAGYGLGSPTHHSARSSPTDPHHRLREASHTGQLPKTTADISHQAGDIGTQATASEQRTGLAATTVATPMECLKVAILPDGTCSLAQVLSPTTALVASKPSTPHLGFLLFDENSN